MIMTDLICPTNWTSEGDYAVPVKTASQNKNQFFNDSLSLQLYSALRLHIYLFSCIIATSIDSA
jgi:hypothetical protein